MAHEAVQSLATLLVIDDEPVGLMALLRQLRCAGYRILTAGSGEEGIEAAVREHPDLILLDVLMPGIDGFETCRRLKERPGTRAIPVIFMTALAEKDDKVRGFRVGGADYLVKPVQPDEARARIATHLGLYRLRDDIDLHGGILLDLAREHTFDGVCATLERFFGSREEVTSVGLWMDAGPDAAGKPRYALRRRIAGAGTGAPGFLPTLAPGDELVERVIEGQGQLAQSMPADILPAHIASPIMQQDRLLGVLVTIYRWPVPDFFIERCKWHRVLADSIGTSLANARSFDEIERLRRRLEQENEYLREEVVDAGAFGEIVGESPALRHVLEQVTAVAPTEASVLILGESGTGKELIARAIHERSRRHDRPLVRVNCAAIPRELFESEFFGHVRGAFTGALKDRAGRFQLADGGTLLLDEVGEIPLELQGKLLRVLQEGTLERVGEEKTRRVDVRIIAASNRDLNAEVEAGRFRRDLFHRLNVVPIVIPPLRDRPEDLAPLIRHFLAQLCRKLGRVEPELTPERLAILSGRAWPGNARELRNELERALILAHGDGLRLSSATEAPAPPAPRPAPPIATAVTPPVNGHCDVLTEAQLGELQRRNIARALELSGGRVDGEGGAAERLGLKGTTLRSRIKVLGLVPAEPAAASVCV